jgi:prepilin-type processing-associated H-X9-DG protein
VLFKYVGNPGVYRCPDDKSTVQGLRALQRTRSYSLSIWLNGDLSFKFSLFKPGVSPYIKWRGDQILNPDQVFAFMEEHEQSIDDGAMELDNPLDGQFSTDIRFDLPSDRQGQAGAVSFADGHVAQWRLNYPKRFIAHLQPATPAVDLKDLPWGLY